MNAIIINLLAEEEQAEQARARDPVKGFVASPSTVSAQRSIHRVGRECRRYSSNIWVAEAVMRSPSTEFVLLFITCQGLENRN